MATTKGGRGRETRGDGEGQAHSVSDVIGASAIQEIKAGLEREVEK